MDVDDAGKHVAVRSVDDQGIAVGGDVRADGGDDPVSKRDATPGQRRPGYGQDRRVPDHHLPLLARVTEDADAG